jgi:tryptophanyl-tRNA synthetase
VTLSGSRRVVSGMRASGPLHLGHYHGCLKSWTELQHEYECFFFVADWHALTSDYEEPSAITGHTWEMIIDWLAVGINPGEATLFIQSRVPEHAELHLLLSMITPIAWLERAPAYREHQERLKDRELSTYGLLGYPLLQSADVLLYRAAYVPVGEDQVSHIEIAREIARRFNYIYGREPDFEDKAQAAAKKLGKRNAKLYFDIRRRYQEQGDTEAIEKGRAFLESQQNVSIGDRERLFGYLLGSGKLILQEPQALLTAQPRITGLDGEKMSKSAGNAIALRESPESVRQKLRTMPTDPARIRRRDPGDPDRCPVWKLHRVYSNEEVRAWADAGCRSAGIGCLECKEPLTDAILAELAPIRERAEEFIEDPNMVRSIVNEGCESAREVARETLLDVRAAMGLAHR